MHLLDSLEPRCLMSADPSVDMVIIFATAGNDTKYQDFKPIDIV